MWLADCGRELVSRSGKLGPFDASFPTKLRRAIRSPAFFRDGRESHLSHFATTIMINAVLVFNNAGQPRLTKFYTQLVPDLATKRLHIGS